jgi:hypothetical protein
MIHYASHPILHRAEEERARLLEEVSKLDIFIAKYKEMAGLEPVYRTETSIKEAFTQAKPAFRVLAMKESLDWAEKILKERGVVATALDFIKEFEDEGCTVPKKTMAAYLSQTKDRFAYDQKNGGWSLVKKAEEQQNLKQVLGF